MGNHDVWANVCDNDHCWLAKLPGSSFCHKHTTETIYYCDEDRHLVCVPYSIENLHRMAAALGIKRCWFHNQSYAHYDIPKKRIAEISARCKVVTPRVILSIVKGAHGF